MLVFPGCAGIIPPEALQWNKETLKHRQLQTRIFDTQKEGEEKEIEIGENKGRENAINIKKIQ